MISGERIKTIQDKHISITFLTLAAHEQDKGRQIHAFMLILPCIYGWKTAFLTDNNETQDEL